jgi:hypothetical protein
MHHVYGIKRDPQHAVLLLEALLKISRSHHNRNQRDYDIVRIIHNMYPLFQQHLQQRHDYLKHKISVSSPSSLYTVEHNIVNSMKMHTQAFHDLTCHFLQSLVSSQQELTNRDKNISNNSHHSHLSHPIHHHRHYNFSSQLIHSHNHSQHSRVISNINVNSSTVPAGNAADDNATVVTVAATDNSSSSSVSSEGLQRTITMLLNLLFISLPDLYW